MAVEIRKHTQKQRKKNCCDAQIRQLVFGCTCSAACDHRQASQALIILSHLVDSVYNFWDTLLPSVSTSTQEGPKMSDIESQRVLGAGIPRTGRLIDVGKWTPASIVSIRPNAILYSLPKYFIGQASLPTS